MYYDSHHLLLLKLKQFLVYLINSRLLSLSFARVLECKCHFFYLHLCISIEMQFNFLLAIDRLKNRLTSLSVTRDGRVSGQIWERDALLKYPLRSRRKGRKVVRAALPLNYSTAAWGSWPACCPFRAKIQRFWSRTRRWIFRRLTVRFPKFFTLHTRCTVFPTSPVKFDCIEVSKWGPVPGVGHSSRKSVRKFLKHDAIPPENRNVYRDYVNLSKTVHFYDKKIFLDLK